MPLILPGNVATATASTAYDIANSCRFNKADTPGLSRSTGDGNERIGSFSFWWKTADPHDGSIFYQVRIDSSNFFNIGMDGGGNIEVTNKDGGSYNLQCETTAIYRDHSAWYHVCAIVDTTQAVAANRMKLYINGIQVTSFQTETYPDQNDDLKMNSNSTTAYISHSGNCVHGYLAEFVAIDGTAQAVTDFGEFDEDSPTIWKPKDVSELTKGVNGFYLDFEDSSALGNCAFGGTDFTVSNLAAADQAVDTPTNNFATLNPLSGTHDNRATYSEGNCKMVTVASGYQQTQSTIGVSAGKWYAECIFLSQDGGAASPGIHAGFSGSQITGAWLGYESGYGYGSMGTTVYHDSSSSSWGSTAASSANDILGIALDLDNKKIYWSVNGTWQNSSDPAANSNGFTIDDDAINTELGFYLFEIADLSSVRNYTYAVNFGGCPGWTLSSAVADGNGYGTFEYAPPSGFLAMCTKNLGSDGG